MIEDCDSALRLDASYLKALRRRAAALESLDRDEEAVRDYTACTLLEAIDPPKRTAASKEPQTGETLERVLKKMATREAQDILSVSNTVLQGLSCQFQIEPTKLTLLLFHLVDPTPSASVVYLHHRLPRRLPTPCVPTVIRSYRNSC